MAGFTQFDNELLQKILTSNLTKRQLKILLLIVRFSSGYQKSYAILRRNDFAYAGVSPYCINDELKKLSKMQVIIWNVSNDTLWINPNLHDWAVDKSVKNPGENLRKFFRIATKNSMKQQLAVYQNSNINLAEMTTANSKETKKYSNTKKEELFLKILREYFLKVAPLTESEMLMLRQVSEGFPPRAIQQAIDAVSFENDRSFSCFLKTLDGFTAEAKRSERPGGLKTSIEKFWKRHSRS